MFVFNMPHFNYLWFMIKVYLEIKKKLHIPVITEFLFNLSNAVENIVLLASFSAYVVIDNT